MRTGAGIIGGRYSTKRMHRFPGGGVFAYPMQVAAFDYIAHSEAMRTASAEKYVELSPALRTRSLGRRE